MLHAHSTSGAANAETFGYGETNEDYGWHVNSNSGQNLYLNAAIIGGGQSTHPTDDSWRHQQAIDNPANNLLTVGYPPSDAVGHSQNRQNRFVHGEGNAALFPRGLVNPKGTYIAHDGSTDPSMLPSQDFSSKHYQTSVAQRSPKQTLPVWLSGDPVQSQQRAVLGTKAADIGGLIADGSLVSGHANMTTVPSEQTHKRNVQDSLRDLQTTEWKNGTQQPVNIQREPSYTDKQGTRLQEEMAYPPPKEGAALKFHGRESPTQHINAAVEVMRRSLDGKAAAEAFQSDHGNQTQGNSQVQTLTGISMQSATHGMTSQQQGATIDKTQDDSEFQQQQAAKASVLDREIFDTMQRSRGHRPGQGPGGFAHLAHCFVVHVFVISDKESQSQSFKNVYVNTGESTLRLSEPGLGGDPDSEEGIWAQIPAHEISKIDVSTLASITIHTPTYGICLIFVSSLEMIDFLQLLEKIRPPVARDANTAIRTGHSLDDSSFQIVFFDEAKDLMHRLERAEPSRASKRRELKAALAIMVCSNWQSSKWSLRMLVVLTGRAFIVPPGSTWPEASIDMSSASIVIDASEKEFKLVDMLNQALYRVYSKDQSSRSEWTKLFSRFMRIQSAGQFENSNQMKIISARMQASSADDQVVEAKKEQHESSSNRPVLKDESIVSRSTNQQFGSKSDLKDARSVKQAVDGLKQDGAHTPSPESHSARVVDINGNSKLQSTIAMKYSPNYESDQLSNKDAQARNRNNSVIPLKNVKLSLPLPPISPLIVGNASSLAKSVSRGIECTPEKYLIRKHSEQSSRSNVSLQMDDALNVDGTKNAEDAEKEMLLSSPQAVSTPKASCHGINSTLSPRSALRQELHGTRAENDDGHKSKVLLEAMYPLHGSTQQFFYIFPKVLVTSRKLKTASHSYGFDQDSFGHPHSKDTIGDLVSQKHPPSAIKFFGLCSEVAYSSVSVGLQNVSYYPLLENAVPDMETISRFLGEAVHWLTTSDDAMIVMHCTDASSRCGFLTACLIHLLSLAEGPEQSIDLFLEHRRRPGTVLPPMHARPSMVFAMQQLSKARNMGLVTPGCMLLDKSCWDCMLTISSVSLKWTVPQLPDDSHQADPTSTSLFTRNPFCNSRAEFGIRIVSVSDTFESMLIRCPVITTVRNANEQVHDGSSAIQGQENLTKNMPKGSEPSSGETKTENTKVNQSPSPSGMVLNSDQEIVGFQRETGRPRDSIARPSDDSNLSPVPPSTGEAHEAMPQSAQAPVLSQDESAAESDSNQEPEGRLSTSSEISSSPPKNLSTTADQVSGKTKALVENPNTTKENSLTESISKDRMLRGLAEVGDVLEYKSNDAMAVTIQGDVRIEIWMRQFSSGSAKLMFSSQFHTKFLDSGNLQLEKTRLDWAWCNPSVPDNLCMTIKLEDSVML